MLRSISLPRHIARPTVLLPLAFLAVACGGGSDTGTAVTPTGDGGPSSDAGRDSASSPDVTAPTVVSTYPVDAATAQATSALISVTFSESLAPASA